MRKTSAVTGKRIGNNPFSNEVKNHFRYFPADELRNLGIRGAEYEEMQALTPSEPYNDGGKHRCIHCFYPHNTFTTEMHWHLCTCEIFGEKNPVLQKQLRIHCPRSMIDKSKKRQKMVMEWDMLETADGQLVKTKTTKQQHSMIDRYSRQILLPPIGMQGQEKLLSSKVLVVGAGGIGSTCLMYLVGAGVSVDVIDFDVVHVSNLHRQIIHEELHEGVSKVDSAVKRLRNLNPSIPVHGASDRLTALNAIPLISKYDIIVDATDNVEVRYTINDACVQLLKPFVTGSALGFEGL